MIKTKHIKTLIIACCLSVTLCTGCSKQQTEKPDIKTVYAQILNQSGGRETIDIIKIPDMAVTELFESESCIINTSHKNNGYVIFTYTGDAEKIILQITQPDNNRYTYPINNHESQVIALVSGDGSYKIDILENTGNNTYVTAESETIGVQMINEFEPFLYPNQYVYYTQNSNCVVLANELSEHANDDLSYVKNVYDYVVADITYDTKLAENVGTNYIPNPDTTLISKKGICFDYASLMTAMLRSQNIPTKLEVGYAGIAYHAWISVYLEETGWIDNIIQFDGKNWSFMDPTVAANQTADAATKKLIGDGTTYTVQYHY